VSTDWSPLYVLNGFALATQSYTNSYFYTVHWRAGIVSFFFLKERLAAANEITECVKTSRLKKVKG
jgi:hypothetical protein